MRTCGKLLAVLIAAVCACGNAAARHKHASGRAAQHPRHHYGHYGYGPLPGYPPPIPRGLPLDEQDWFLYGFSGTRGRMGLGASPFHPEGPGNFSSPGR